MEIPEGFKFQLYELCDPHTFKSRSAEIAWDLFRQDAIDALHGLRTFLNLPITVNNWYSGGPYEWSGYRSPECTIGAKGSQHRLGNAFDCKIKGMDADTARQVIKLNQNDSRLVKIQRMEDDVSWLHFDLMPVENRIHIFRA